MISLQLNTCHGQVRMPATTVKLAYSKAVLQFFEEAPEQFTLGAVIDCFAEMVQMRYLEKFELREEMVSVKLARSDFMAGDGIHPDAVAEI